MRTGRSAYSCCAVGAGTFDEHGGAHGAERAFLTGAGSAGSRHARPAKANAATGRFEHPVVPETL